MVCPARQRELLAKSDSKAGKVANHQQVSSLVVSEQYKWYKTAKGDKGQA